MEEIQTLSEKYNRPVPRYTSYPTIPFWNNAPDLSRWEASVKEQFANRCTGEGISLYIHLPFCESLCTYCGCNKKITTNHKVEEPYISALLREWSMYLSFMEGVPLIREIHLGGGTPTFFSPGNLTRLLTSILDSAKLHPLHSFSVEGHPNNTTREHLDALFRLGFRRISLGVQDTNPEVQRIINRIQPFENVRMVTEEARKVGYTSVNFDLVYGLPAQNRERLLHTVTETLSLRPDRIAFYSYAHTPWISCAQRLIDEKTLPTPPEKLALYLAGKELFSRSGYTDIGMDHFALPSDELYKAWTAGNLQRNFMGYTTQNGAMLIGLGVSAISDTGAAFAQNDKTIAGYYRAIESGRPAILKNHFLTREDMIFRKHILDIACKGSTTIDPRIGQPEYSRQLNEQVIPRLKELEEDGLVTWHDTTLRVTPPGRHFIRNICQAFDLYMGKMDYDTPPLCGKSSFSKAI